MIAASCGLHILGSNAIPVVTNLQGRVITYGDGVMPGNIKLRGEVNVRRATLQVCRLGMSAL